MAMNVGSSVREDGDVMVDINTTPLIDVMLVLLIMFIITIPIQTHAVKMNMPVPNPNAPPPKPPVIIRIDVDFDGRSAGTARSCPTAPRWNPGWAVAAEPDQPEVHLRPNKLGHLQARGDDHGLGPAPGRHQDRHRGQRTVPELITLPSDRGSAQPTAGPRFSTPRTRRDEQAARLHPFPHRRRLHGHGARPGPARRGRQAAAAGRRTDPEGRQGQGSAGQGARGRRRGRQDRRRAADHRPHEGRRRAACRRHGHRHRRRWKPSPARWADRSRPDRRAAGLGLCAAAQQRQGRRVAEQGRRRRATTAPPSSSCRATCRAPAATTPPSPRKPAGRRVGGRAGGPPSG
jgi:biopolymer transport protein ExbD